MTKHILFGLLSATVLLASCTQKPAVHPTDEPFRSVYHHTPEANWMNDPNGMFYDEANGVWHLYYQHNPFGTTWVLQPTSSLGRNTPLCSIRIVSEQSSPVRQ